MIKRLSQVVKMPRFGSGAMIKNLTLGTRKVNINFSRSPLMFWLTSLSIFLCVTVLFPIHGITAQTNSTSERTFEQWCEQKDSLPAETRKTVESLLKKADTKNCKLASSILKLTKKLEGSSGFKGISKSNDKDKLII